MQQQTSTGNHPVTATLPPDRAEKPRFTLTSGFVPVDPESRDQRWPDQWPRRSYLELAALETAPGCARKHACALLWEWKLDAITDESALIVSELVTNAMLSTQVQGLSEPVRMWVLGSGSSALFLVWDATMPAPVPANPAPDAEHGRGLTLVDALSTRWGCYYPAGPPGGKVVWGLIGTPDAVPHDTTRSPRVD